MQVDLKKTSPWATRWWKPHDPRFISFDALSACDRRTRRLLLNEDIGVVCW